MSTFSIKIVRMAVEHIAQIALLERSCFSQPWSEKSLEQELKNEDAYFVAAVNEKGEVLGYGGMHTPCGDCYIDNIAVNSDFRNRGIGDLLVKALVDRAKGIGNFISLEVRASNGAAISLYLKNGFIRAGLRKSFYCDPTEDALILTKYF